MLLQADLPGLGGAEAGAVIAARVAAVDKQHELTSARFDGGELWVSGLREPGDDLDGPGVAAADRADLAARRAFIANECTYTDASAGRKTGEYLLRLVSGELE